MILNKLIIEFTEAHIHPAIVHFPIAMILTGYLIYCIYIFRKKDNRKFALFSYYFLICSALATFVTAFTGIFYTPGFDFLNQSGKNVLIDHRFWAMCTTIMICITAFIKLIAYFTTKKNVQSYDWPTFAFYTLSAFCVLITAVRGVEFAFGYLKGPLFLP